VLHANESINDAAIMMFFVSDEPKPSRMLSQTFLFLGMLISKDFGDMLMLQDMEDDPQTVSNSRQLSLAKSVGGPVVNLVHVPCDWFMKVCFDIFERNIQKITLSNNL